MRNGGRTRVAVTGVGVVSPLGIGREEMWRSVAEGRSGAGLITLFDAADSPVRMACEAHGFDPTDFMERRAARRMDRYAQLAVAAARLAVADSGLTIDDDGAGIGAIIGNGGSGAISREEQHRVMLERGPDRVSPFAIPLSVANMGAGQVSIELGLRGPVAAVCTACAAGTDAIGTAADIIRRGDVFGWAPLVEGHARRIATAYCLTACEVVAIDGAALNRLMEGDPGLGYALMKKLAVLLTSELVAFAAA